MGFGDMLGDAWEAFKDTGESSLGVAMDYAKATQNVAEGDSPWKAARGFNRSFSNRRQNFLSEHKTLNTIAAGALKTLEGGLYALSIPAHYVQRGVSTGIQHDGPLDIPGFDGTPGAGHPSLKDAWRNSAKTSTGQALLVATGQAGPGTEGITFRNAWKYGDKENALYNNQFSWRSGTLDALMIFTDPLIIAGKGAKMARLSREAIKADDVKALNNKPAKRYYHGSNQDIKVGDTVRPGGAPSRFPEKWGTEDRAFATEHPGEAMMHGDNWYEVEPLADDLAEDANDARAWSSKSGFRVVRKLDTADMKKAADDFRNPTTPSLSRRQQRVVKDHESLIDATEGTSSYENYLLFSRHGVTNAAGLASVLSQAKHEPQIRSLVLRHSMGDADATAALRAQREDLIDQVNRMNRDLDDQIFPEFGTKSHDGLFDADYWDTPEARAELLRQRDDSEALLDTYNRTVGDDDKMVDSALPTQDEVGLKGSMIKRTHATRRDLQWMKGQSAYYVQPGVGGIVTRVLRSPRNMQPSGYVDFHDAQQGIAEVDSFTKRIPGLLPEERTEMMGRYINAPDDNARRQVLEGIEDHAFDALGRRYGYAHEDMLELKRRFVDERNTAWAKSKGGDKIFGFNAAGVAERRPLGEAQLDNGAFTMPIDEMKRVLHRNSGRYQALKNVSGAAFSFTDQMLDFVNDIWKFQALFRGGYPIRNAADGQLRMMAFLGAHSYLGIQKEALSTFVRNDLGKTADYRAGVVTQRPMLGEGERNLGPYEGLADAMGKTGDEAQAYYQSISGVDNISAFISGKYHSILDDLRGTGRWVGKKGDEEGYNDDMIRVVNQTFRNSAITQRLLKGWEPERIVSWLKDGKGRGLRRRMVFGNDSPEALVLRNIENLNHMLPREYWQRFADRPMTADDIAEIWGDNLAARPVVNAEQIAYSQGQGHVAESLQRLQKAYFKGVSMVTDDGMGRHPLFVSLYRGRQIELMKRMDPKMKGVLELADQRRIEQQARIWARREMKGIMFDVAQKSDLAHFVRFIMPFYAAWQDAFFKYAKLMVRDPSRFGYLSQLWTAPNDAAFLEVTNVNGEIVRSEDSKLTDDEGVVIPLSWAKKIGISWSPKISKSSFNIALQGDPLWLPGWGPMGVTPVNELIRKTDNADLASAAQGLGILPFGVQDYGKAGWKAFLAGGLRQEGLSEGRKQRLLAQTMQTMYFEAARAGKPEPSWKDIKSKYQALLDLRRVTSALSPVSVQYQSPYQFYIDQSHAYDSQVGPGLRFKDFAEADAAFLKDFGEDYYIFRMSMSKTNVAIAPSKQADKAARKVRDLIDANPRYASLFIGPNNTGEFDRNVYTLQQGRRIGESANTWRDTYDDPQEAIRLNRVEQGWVEYQKMAARVNAVMESRGLTSINQKEATDLRQLKHEWIERIAGEGGPAWGQAWYDDYQEFGSTAVTGFLGAAKQAIKDDRINSRPDIQALAVYVDARTKVRQVLQARYRAGGSASLTSQSNGDLASIWAELGTRLRQQNVYFEDYWSRYLERDDLTKVVR